MNVQDTLEIFPSLPNEAAVPVPVGVVVTGTSRSTIYRMLASGKLTRVRVGYGTKLNVGELRRLIGGAR